MRQRDRPYVVNGKRQCPGYAIDAGGFGVGADERMNEGREGREDRPSQPHSLGAG